MNYKNCKDIDECAINGTLECGVTPFSCENSEGSYECTCEKGYDGANCEDIDECLGETICDSYRGAECKNTIGSYQCSCEAPFVGSDYKDCTETSLLIVQQQVSSEALMVTYSGREVSPSFASNQTLTESCHVTFRNQFFIFGGNQNETKIAQVDDCEVKTVGELPFSFRRGLCTANQNEIYLCFGYGSSMSCRVANKALNFTSSVSSTTNSMHSDGALAAGHG